MDIIKKSEKLFNKNVFYVFVHLHQLDTPTYFIVPSKIVAETISREHKNWLESTNKKGEPHKDNDIRTIKFEDDLFLDKWDYLN